VSSSDETDLRAMIREEVERCLAISGHGTLIDFECLRRFSGYRQVSAVKKWMQKNHIKYMTNTDGYPVTTIDAINKALEYRTTDRHSTNRTLQRLRAIQITGVIGGGFK
jgi:hypothetical protein